jgi:hypothetical protein
MGASYPTTLYPDRHVDRPLNGLLTVAWTDSLKVAAPAIFGVWLVDLPGNGWYGGWVVEADGSGSYELEVTSNVMPGTPLTPVVYYCDYTGAPWGGTPGDCYDFAPATVTFHSFTTTGCLPVEGPAGTQVVINGTGFGPEVTRVFFGGVSAGTRFSVVSDTQVVAYAPAGVGTSDIYVESAGVMSPQGATFRYTDTGVAPTVSSVTPNIATDKDGGEQVTVRGTGLASVVKVSFGSDPYAPLAAFDVVSDLELTVLTPPGDGTVDVIVTNPWGQSPLVAGDQFTYPAPPAPVVSSVTPPKGFPGDPVTITGDHFDTASSVAFGTEQTTFMAVDDTTILCYVPENPTGWVHVIVTGPGGDSAQTEADEFFYGDAALPVTSAAGVDSSAFEGWEQGDATVTLTVDPNGGPGVAGTFYVIDDGGIQTYAAPFVVSGPGSHLLRFWSVDVRGKIEPPHVAYVNILAPSTIPTGLVVTPIGVDAVLAKWAALASDRPVSYRLYVGPAGAGPWTLAADTTTNVLSVAQLNSAGARYYAVASVGVDGLESAKSGAVGPITAATFSAEIPDLSIDATKIADDAITTPKLFANCVTANEINVASIQSAVVTAAVVNALALNAGSITAGTLDVARIAAGSIQAAKLDAADVKANIITAGYINTLSLDAGAIKAGTIDVARLNVGAILASQMSAAWITGGSISGVVISGGTVRTTPTASGKRVELSTDHTLKFYSGDVSEIGPGTITAYTYGSGGGYMSLSGPRVTGQPMSSYMSLHGAAGRADILFMTYLGASVTIAPASKPYSVLVGGDLDIISGYDLNLDGNGHARFKDQSHVECGRVEAYSGSLYITPVNGTLQVQGIVQCSGVRSSGSIRATGNFVSGVSDDGVWINDAAGGARRYKLYFDSGNGRLYARYDGSTYSFFARAGGSAGF